MKGLHIDFYAKLGYWRLAVFGTFYVVENVSELQSLLHQNSSDYHC